MALRGRIAKKPSKATKLAPRVVDKRTKSIKSVSSEPKRPPSVVRIARVLAAVRQGGAAHKNFKAMLLCGLEAGNVIADGEWMGYVRTPYSIIPFVIEKSGSAELVFEGNEGFRTPTNLGQRPMTPGTLFTVLPPEDDAKAEEIVFEVISCHLYESVSVS